MFELHDITHLRFPLSPRDLGPWPAPKLHVPGEGHVAASLPLHEANSLCLWCEHAQQTCQSVKKIKKWHEIHWNITHCSSLPHFPLQELSWTKVSSLWVSLYIDYQSTARLREAQQSLLNANWQELLFHLFSSCMWRLSFQVRLWLEDWQRMEKKMQIRRICTTLLRAPAQLQHSQLQAVPPPKREVLQQIPSRPLQLLQLQPRLLRLPPAQPQRLVLEWWYQMPLHPRTFQPQRPQRRPQLPLEQQRP